MLIDIGADDKEDAKKLAFVLVNKLFRFVRSHRWQTIKKFLRKHGIIAMVVGLQLNY